MELTTAPTLRTLLHRPELRLALISDSARAEEWLDRPVRWVHSSDLIDPTPFLADDLVLLTTGSQLSRRASDTAEYVARLVHRGVLALGFGSGVHTVGVPDTLAEACAAAGLTLFEVPYDIPFLAIARAHAEAIAAQAYARRTWALESQRAIAIAALRPRALESTLAELSRRLGCWVGMYDAAGALVHEHPHPLARGAETVRQGASDMLARGGAASRTLEDGDAAFTLFTLGRSGRLRGIIAIAMAALDPETRTVVTSVIAMAGLALEQNAQNARARRRLHAQVLSSLRSDDPALARRVLGSLPAAPVTVAVTQNTGRVDAVLDWWERRRTDAGTAAFVAEAPEGLVMCVSAHDQAAYDELAERFDIRLGVSGAWEYTRFSQALGEALTAFRHGASGVARYDAGDAGILDALTGEEVMLRARARLAPLRRHDEVAGSDLEQTLTAWLEHDTHSERTAAALGIHRHTLRARIAQASALLGTDLSSFPARAEVWAALRAARADAG